ncbi:MAG: MarR family winged helix-turn-helix transcriptional regulator [Brevefilum sp.]
MANHQYSAERRMLSLFKRLQKIGLNRCPNFEDITSPAQMALLEQIIQHPGCGVQDIASALNLSAPTVSVGVAKLEERGLVERKPDPDDRRSVQFFITDNGKELHERFNQARLEKFHHLLSGLSKQDQINLLNLLERALQSAEMDDARISSDAED